MNELYIAKLIAKGELPSPYPVKGAKYYLLDFRISGTGYAYRDKKEQYVLRDPDDYLTDNVLSMCSGLPVIFEHPQNGFDNNCETIGTVFYPYIKADDSEIWGIAKIWNEDALEDIINNHYSTSCSFRAGTKQIDVDGTLVLKDLPPQSCNHVAILRDTMGVWDKLLPEKAKNAINVNNQEDTSMAENEETSAPEGVNDRLLRVLDSLATRLDGIDARLEGLEGAEKTEVQEQKPEVKLDSVAAELPSGLKKEPETEVKVDADKDGSADVEIKNDELADLKGRVDNLENASTQDDSEIDDLAQMQEDSMEVSAMLGISRTKPLSGEPAKSYRKRSLKGYMSALGDMKVSHEWQGVNVENLDDSALAIAYKQVLNKLKGIQPTATKEQPIRAFVKRGQGGLSDETHFAIANAADYFKTV